MTDVPGVDYAWSHPSPSSLRAAGKQFAARYSSTDPDKDLTRAEADALAAAGIASVLVRESTANRAGAGRAAGITDAQAALKTATGCAMPPMRPLYFAVDYDADPIAVVPYFQGVASVVGLARTGVYGGYDVVRYLLDHGLATWAWQTRAWSAGRWDPRAHIRQGATQTIGGVSCDLNTAMTADYGQWMPGRLPALEEDVPLTDAEMDKIATLSAKKTLAALGAPAGVLATIDNPTVADDPKRPAADDESVRALLWDTGMHAGRADAKADTILAALAKLAGQVGAAPAAFSAAVAADLAKRLQS